jgi:hypothetical protein
MSDAIFKSIGGCCKETYSHPTHIMSGTIITGIPEPIFKVLLPIYS